MEESRAHRIIVQGRNRLGASAAAADSWVLSCIYTAQPGRRLARGPLQIERRQFTRHGIITWVIGFPESDPELGISKERAKSTFGGILKAERDRRLLPRGVGLRSRDSKRNRRVIRALLDAGAERAGAIKCP